MLCWRVRSFTLSSSGLGKGRSASEGEVAGTEAGEQEPEKTGIDGETEVFSSSRLGFISTSSGSLLSFALLG